MFKKRIYIIAIIEFKKYMDNIYIFDIEIWLLVGI